ncbi:hypothetical protein CDIK_0497 [Cucumispora dikerogammari]|nr:hypothetical protein CDIK_0497 [Cucumispora dikerogammari]
MSLSMTFIHFQILSIIHLSKHILNIDNQTDNHLQEQPYVVSASHTFDYNSCVRTDGFEMSDVQTSICAKNIAYEYQTEPLNLTTHKKTNIQHIGDPLLSSPSPLTSSNSDQIDSFSPYSRDFFRLETSGFPTTHFMSSFPIKDMVYLNNSPYKAQHIERTYTKVSAQGNALHTNNTSIPGTISGTNDINKRHNEPLFQKRPCLSFGIETILKGPAKRQRIGYIVDSDKSVASKNEEAYNKHTYMGETSSVAKKSTCESNTNLSAQLEKYELECEINPNIKQHKNQCINTDSLVNYNNPCCTTTVEPVKSNIEISSHDINPKTINFTVEPCKRNELMKHISVFKAVYMQVNSIITKESVGKLFEVYYGPRSVFLETPVSTSINFGKRTYDIYTFKVESFMKLEDGSESVDITVNDVPMFWDLCDSGGFKVCKLLQKKYIKNAFYKEVRINAHYHSKGPTRILEILPMFVLTAEKNFFSQNYVKKIKDWKCSNEQSYNRELDESDKIGKSDLNNVKKSNMENKKVTSRKRISISSIVAELENKKKIIMDTPSRNKKNMIDLVKKFEKLHLHLYTMRCWKLPNGRLKEGVQEVYSFHRDFISGGEQFIKLIGINNLERLLIGGYNRVYSNLKILLSSIVDSYNKYLLEESDERINYNGF